MLLAVAAHLTVFLPTLVAIFAPTPAVDPGA
jgi:hypothetical protein